MKGYSSFFEFIINVFCFATPIDGDYLQNIPRSIPLISCLVAVAIFAFSLIQQLINYVLGGNKFIVYGISACVTILSFAFIDLKDWNTIFSILYVPLIFVIRGLEGGLIASTFKPKVWVLILVPILMALLLIYFLLGVDNSSVLTLFVLIWTVSGIIMASYRWTVMFKKNNLIGLNSLSIIALFFIFLSTLIYIPNSKLDMIIYLLIFPVGFGLGLIFMFKLKGKMPFLDDNEETMPNT